MDIKTVYARTLLALTAFAAATALATDPTTSASTGTLPEFERYVEQPPPKVPAHKDALTFYPCSQCHDHWQANPTPRQLAPVHDVALDHGQGRLWCLECHNLDDRDALQTLRGGKVDFDQSWKVCGQCHSQRQKDWYFGAHGKRADGHWQGDRESYDCTHCHNPHQPPFLARKPSPPPPVRAGLQPMPERSYDNPPVWLRHSLQASEGDSDE
jgi:hypothetical protein